MVDSAVHPHAIGAVRLAELKDAGVQAVSLSLDGSTAAAHNGVRGVPGTFDATLEALGWGPTTWAFPCRSTPWSPRPRHPTCRPSTSC